MTTAARKKRQWPATARLTGLPGTAAPRMAVEARSAAEAWAAFCDGHDVTAAGSTGALNVWRDDAGQFRAEFMRHRVTLDALCVRRIMAVRKWLGRWWPSLGRDK